MIEIKNLHFSYGSTPVLENISMNLQKGRIYGLLGENGVGKTTLLTLLCGLKKPVQGTVLIDGSDPYERRPSLLAQIAYLPDEVLPLKQSAASFALRNGKFWPGFTLERFYDVMSAFEMDPNMMMNRMSAGQLKKTYISFALACSTKYLFLDEPTNGLDIPSKAQFRKAITKYTESDSIIVISTHQVKDLENIIDPIIILDRREVLLDATIEEITDKLYFDYGVTLLPEALYSEQLPGGYVQVVPNSTGEESRVNIEALFNAVHAHKEFIKNIFNGQDYE